MKSKDYWKSRMEELENEQYRRSMEYYKDVQGQFAQAEKAMQADIERWYRRLADNNGISYTAAKKLLKDRELEEFHWTVERYIEAGKENALDQRWMKQLENASARYHIDRLEAMKLQVRQHAELLFKEFEGGMGDFLHAGCEEQFYRTAWEVAKGTGIGFNLARLDTRRIDALIRRPWAQDGKVFSDRIWSNKEKLVNALHTELAQCIIRGDAPMKAIARLAKKMGTGKVQAGTLIMTEAAAIASASQKECFRELGVEKYEFDATLDGDTCDVCAGMDGQIFPMSQYEIGVTAPPVHPRCRCCTLPGFDDWEEYDINVERAARDPESGKTVYVDGNLNYGEWKKRFAEGGEKGYEFTLTYAMKAAVIRYVSPESNVLNDKLRHGDGFELTDSEKQWIIDLDEALDVIPRYEGDLNRAVNISDPELLQEFLDDFVEGKEWSSGQYISTAKGDQYNPDANVQIYIQGAKQGHDLGHYNDAEQEVLYDRNAKFIVVKKMQHLDKWWILLEEV